MKWMFAVMVCLAALSSCAQNASDKLVVPVGKKEPAKNEAVATFAEGCFWHTELVFQSLEGVRDAVSGYAGGKRKNPTYEEVCTGTTGHAECVQVYYDPSKISYETLVAAFFASHDPTTLNRQGPDVGTQYRSVAFYRNPKEKQVIEAEIGRLKASGKYKRPVVTQVVPYGSFYPAEEVHQEYIFYHRGNPYVRSVSIPDFLKFRKEFPGKFRN
jgi:peptide-methionine (S)-S-oxide reductase